MALWFASKFVVWTTFFWSFFCKNLTTRKFNLSRLAKNMPSHVCCGIYEKEQNLIRISGLVATSRTMVATRKLANCRFFVRRAFIRESWLFLFLEVLIYIFFFGLNGSWNQNFWDKVLCVILKSAAIIIFKIKCDLVTLSLCTSMSSWEGRYKWPWTPCFASTWWRCRRRCPNRGRWPPSKNKEREWKII